MPFTRARASRAFLALALAFASLVLVPDSAAFSEPMTPRSAPSVTESRLVFDGFDSERAASNGYSIRTTAQGYQYAVPLTIAPGDMTGASILYDPVTKRTFQYSQLGSSKYLSPSSTSTSDCGSSWVYFNGSQAQIRTGYSSNPLYGLPLYRTWNVSVHSPYDLISLPFSGPATGFYWQAYKQTGIYSHRGNVVSAIAGGELVTTFMRCRVASPSATITSAG